MSSAGHLDIWTPATSMTFITFLDAFTFVHFGLVYCFLLLTIETLKMVCLRYKSGLKVSVFVCFCLLDARLVMFFLCLNMDALITA